MTPAELPYIDEAICSVIQQTVACEIILLVPEDRNEFDPAIARFRDVAKILRAPMRPVGVIRNLGISEAKTDWIGFLDGDDAWVPHKVRYQIELATASDRQAIGSRHILVREDSQPYFHGFAKKTPLPSSFLVRKDLLLKEPFSDLPCWEDVEFWDRLKRQNVTATHPDYLIRYRVRRGSLSSGTPAKERKFLFAQLSTLPLARPLLLSASRLAGKFVACR